MNPTKTGQFIQQLRKERKLTQSELADILMITNKAVSRWETGDGFPDVVLLPKLSAALGVSVDEILNGERYSKESTKQALHHLKLRNAFLISIVVIVLSYMLFLGLAYGTFKPWIAFIGYVIPATLGLLWLLIERNQFMVLSVYDDHDQKLLFHTLFISVSVYVAGLFMTLPQVIHAIQSSFPDSVISFSDYILAALSFGLLGFIMVVFCFVYMYERGKYLKHHRPLANKLLLLIGLVFVITVFSIPFYLGTRIIGVHGFLLFMGAGIYYTIKKLDTPYMLMIRFFVSVSLMLGVNAYTISEARVNVFFILFVLAVAVVLVIGVIWLTNRQYNALFRFSYQSLFLVLFTFFSHQLIYALMITLPALILFEVIVVEKVKRLSHQKV